MSEPEPNDRELDQRFEELFRAHNDADNRCLERTAVRIAGEIKRLAKAERQLMPYIRAHFFLTNAAENMLDPEMGREAAIELIALLESEDRARLIQPDFDPAAYERTIAVLSSCAYDNLAKATAAAHGYNSEGVHNGISEGIQICRRTGKLECITCFREYATSVYRASDDLEMALHHARFVAAHGDIRPGFDRRWGGADDEARLHLLAGRLEMAEATALRALELSPTNHNPLRARLHSLDTLETIRLLQGKTEPPEDPGGGRTEIPPSEYPAHDLRRSANEALRDCVRGDHESAIARLVDWDRKLLERHALVHWFDVRIRLVAAHRLAGRDDKAVALARPLETRAKESRDWVTLHRLAFVFDPSVPLSPFPTTAPLSSGPFALSNTAPAIIDGAATEPAPELRPQDDADAVRESTPLGEALNALMQRVPEAQDDPAVRSELLEKALAFGPDSATHPADAALLIHVVHSLGFEVQRASKVWEWAEAIAAPFSEDATILNLLANLGAAIRGAPDPSIADQVPLERIEGLFRKSLHLDSDNIGNFARAGAYYMGAGNEAEAERCLARGFRLARSSSFLALRLAEIYNQTDRARDAQAVLDLCLREGCEKSEVAWEAALTANRLEQFEMMLTYLDRFEGLAPGQPWTNYFRAGACLDLGRPDAALVAIDEEERRNSECRLPLEALRACAFAALGNLDRMRSQVTAVLAVRLAEVEYLTHAGLVRLFARLGKAAEALPLDDPLYQALEERLLVTGLAPNELFERARRLKPRVEGVNFYQCTILQPLDARWPDSAGCLQGESGWTAYRLLWGVLARDEDEAGHEVLAWQQRCHHVPASVQTIDLRDSGFHDHPGVVWQGYRDGEPS